MRTRDTSAPRAARSDAAPATHPAPPLAFPAGHRGLRAWLLRALCFFALPLALFAAASGDAEAAARRGRAARSAEAARAATPQRPPPTLEAPGFTRILQLETAAYDAHPDVLVHAPTGYDPRGPIHLVVFLHGWRGCIAALAVEHGPCAPGGPPRRGLDLVRQFDRAGVNALLVVPQLAYLTNSSAPGRLGEPGGFRAMMAELLSHSETAQVLGGPRTVDELGRVVILAHSGAFHPTALVLANGQVDVHEVHLLDALYRIPDGLAAWAREHAADFAAGAATPRRLTSVYTSDRLTGRRSLALVESVAGALPDEARTRVVYHHRDAGDPPPQAYGHRLLTVRSTTPHGIVPRKYLTDLVKTAGLPPLPAVSASAAAPGPQARGLLRSSR